MILDSLHQIFVTVSITWIFENLFPLNIINTHSLLVLFSLEDVQDEVETSIYSLKITEVVLEFLFILSAYASKDMQIYVEHSRNCKR